MGAWRLRKGLAGFVSGLMLGACGSLSSPLDDVRVSHPAASARLQARSLPVVSGPLTACRVLSTMHDASRGEAPRAAFVSLHGTRITHNGTPRPEGEWRATYITTEPHNLPLKADSLLSRAHYKQVIVTVTGSGNMFLHVDELAGLPLGQAFFDAPMPPVDSHAILERARVLRPSQPLSSEVRLILTGLMGPHHFHELVWKLHSTVQGGFERPLVFSATTGAPVLR